MAKRSQVALLALTAGLFLAWMGCLVFLVVTKRVPVILSRPQVFVAELEVSAQVERLGGPITISEVLGGLPMNGVREGASLKVANLDECLGWIGPGRYLVPLTREDSRSFQVTAIPPSLGYTGGRPQIYPDTPKTRAQLQHLLQEFHKQ